jgi:glutathione S-transferase
MSHFLEQPPRERNESRAGYAATARSGIQGDMPSASIVLYTDAFWISPYVFTCFVALREKGLPFKTRSVALQDKEQRGAAFRTRSLTGRVPALEHGDFMLTESNAIVDYLEEAFPAPAYPSVYPADVQARARARQLLGWIRTDLIPIREERATHTMFYTRATDPLSAAGRDAAERLLFVADQLVTEGTPTLFGAFGIADADLAFMLQRLLLNGEPVPAKLASYARGVWERPSIREFVTHVRLPYVPY